MYARGLKRLPVVDAAGHLVGIISRTDVLAVFDRTDEDIRVEITRQVIPRLSEPSFYWVVVKNGIVTMEGTRQTVSIGRNVLARVRRVQGVVAVRDRLTYPLPPRPPPPAVLLAVPTPPGGSQAASRHSREAVSATASAYSGFPKPLTASARNTTANAQAIPSWSPSR